jgi:hypothetical protein
MDITSCTSDQLLEFAAGYRAARFGEPMNPHATDLWLEGFLFWILMHPETTSPQMTAQPAT